MTANAIAPRYSKQRINDHTARRGRGVVGGHVLGAVVYTKTCCMPCLDVTVVIISYRALSRNRPDEHDCGKRLSTPPCRNQK
jgi:hypothetical protein